MTKAQQARLIAWRLEILNWAEGEPRQVARTCRHFGISRTLFYRWKRRYEEHGEAGLADRSRAAHRYPTQTPPGNLDPPLSLASPNTVSASASSTLAAL